MVKHAASPSPADRQALLADHRRLKMARSAHAYVRGSTEKFYQWLEARGDHGLPRGPPVWICGDCHLGNLGPVASAAGEVEVQIRDLDQTVIGNPAHDLIRLGLSLATAARGSDLPGVTTASMLEEMMAGYQAAVGGEGETGGPSKRPRAIDAALNRSIARRWRDLAQARIEDVLPRIARGTRFWDLGEDESAALAELFSTDDVQRMVTALKSRDADADVSLIDAAYWMKGCSSLGRLRYAALVGVGGSPGRAEELCLIDVKEAVQPAAPRYPDAVMPRVNAERVVAGARALSPHLGERMLAGRLLGRSVVLRELRPQDLKLEIDTLSREEAKAASHYLGAVVGRAHGGQMAPEVGAEWRADLFRRWPKGLDAPFWLWSSIVDLVASHEAAYLEHCRRYALAEHAA
ncbi:MAG TPA: DUF2252 family protein [Caulobacteraceae bacterium]|nr:DUF2252 family protein [Caulobacteraceae bacterium]